MNIGLLGTSYKHSPLTFLETVYMNRERAKEFLQAFPDNSLVSEIAILATCNRVEFYFVADDLDTASEWLISHLSSFLSINALELRNRLILTKKIDAIQHLFSVSSGMDSMVFGESEILGQLKTSYYLSHKNGGTGSMLNKVFQTAIAVGKRARDETFIAKGSASISSIAIEVLRKQNPEYANQNVLIIGAGIMGMRAIKRLSSMGHPNIFIANRTDSKSKLLAERFGINHVLFSDVKKRLDEFSSIIVAISVDKYYFNKEDFGSNKDTFLIDLGVPRTVDPELENIVTLVTIDGLKDMAQNTLKLRENEKPRVEAIIQEEISELNRWQAYKEKCLVQASA